MVRRNSGLPRIPPYGNMPGSQIRNGCDWWVNDTAFSTSKSYLITCMKGQDIPLTWSINWISFIRVF